MADFFEDIVVGSSPLMLLQALRLSKQGRSVCVLERNDRLGGVWQTVTVGDEKVEVEIGCHVIEAFPHVYEYLAETSRVPFVELEEQPIRINKAGVKVKYFSRTLLLISGVRLVLGRFYFGFLSIFPSVKNKNLLLNYKSKLSSFIKYQLNYLVQSPKMQGPKYGFVDFIEKLIEQCEAYGVIFKQCDVDSISKESLVWRVKDKGLQEFTASNVYCTTSANLKKKEPGLYKAVLTDLSVRVGIVVDVSNHLIRTRQTYVAFWKDSHVARISRVDSRSQSENYTRFLVEFIRDDEYLEEILMDKLIMAGIVRESAKVKIVGKATCPFVNNIDQMKPGEIEESFFGHYSLGNLAAGVAMWLKESSARL